MLDRFADASLTIERANAKDASDVASILRRAYSVHAAAGLNFSAATATEEHVRSRIRRHEVYVLRRSEYVIGTVTLRTKNVGGDDVGYVNGLAIDPQLQRSGLGAELLARAEREMAGRGLPSMRLDTAKPAVWLVRWYELRGYKIVDEVHWQGKTYDSVVMEKRLGTGGVSVARRLRSDRA